MEKTAKGKLLAALAGAAGLAGGGYAGHELGKKKGIRKGYSVGHRVGFTRGTKREHALHVALNRERRIAALQNALRAKIQKSSSVVDFYKKAQEFKNVDPKHRAKFKANMSNPPGPAGGPGVAVKKQGQFKGVDPKHLHKFRANKKNPPGPAGGPGVAVKKEGMSKTAGTFFTLDDVSKELNGYLAKFNKQAKEKKK